MGWGNGQVDYGYQTLGGVVETKTVYVDDSETISVLRDTIKTLQGHVSDLQRSLDATVISKRAHAIVAYTLANSENRAKRSKPELEALYKKAHALCTAQVEQIGIKQFAENPPRICTLEP